MESYFSGSRLIGDDYDEKAILDWYRDEEFGYYKLWGQGREANFYDYHALNARHAFRHLPDGPLGKLISFGGANGEEIRSIAARTSQIVIVDPADYGTRAIQGITVEYRKALPLGTLPAAAGEFHVLTCFGVLHHIPNVSAVLAEFFRALAPGGLALIREPTVSLGDWQRPRTGLTKRERGIPLGLFQTMISNAGFDILRCTRCVHPITPRLGALLGVRKAFNSPALVWVDSCLSSLTFWRARYHAEHFWHRLQPASVYLLLRKSQITR
jgi:SAM-dependent methyltransferase